MADMAKNHGFAENQLPPAQPQPGLPQSGQYLGNSPHTQSITTMLNQNNSGVQEMLKGKLKALGITQIVTGTIAIIIGIIQIVLGGPACSISAVVGTPWWTGILFIIAGALAVAVEKEPTQCMIRACLAMNIVSAISCLPAIILYSSNLTVPVYLIFCFSSVLIPCVAILLVLTLLNAAISIAVSSFNCKAMNGCCAPPVPVIVMYNNPPVQPVPQQQFPVNPPPYNMTVMENLYVG
ncbi:membrane-spanning 4-domains subfamily A member 8-like [Scyliorhinus canicula]|uniref:membrane-spanning 4-domains subfamily A member 8-like n=1 Tax=Scyliorhinus canicula TaxID=7830 RepID=UPI0018F569D9|nr:membrane-spanning 4-domains subfamily A member 8-like [Scyliorhinus canicula]XP_038671089.1 membrane-spanning 4-domains subfamily A member 8-like [Scyliorhinus canicula]